MDNLKFELSQTKTQLRISLEERAKDQEAIELFQERVAELEIENDQLSLQLGQAAKQCNDALAEAEEARKAAKKARLNAYVEVRSELFEDFAKHKGAEWDVEAEFKKLEDYRRLLEGKPPIVEIESGDEETDDGC